MKLLIFGGSFNPVHTGHVNLLESLVKLIEPDKTIIIPTYLPVHKQVGSDFLSPDHRLKMCRLAFTGDVEISEIEISQSKPCYTYDTLIKLSAVYPDAQLYLACGTDMFVTFDKWYRYLDIYKLATICVVSRDERKAEILSFAQKEKQNGMKYIIANAEPFKISSSEIRDMIKQGRDIAEYVPKPVCDYITDNHLYAE